MERLRAKSIELTDFLERLIRRWRGQVHIITPRDSARAAVSCRCVSAAADTRVFAALGARGMVCDWRSPDIIRVAPVPLYNRFEDAWQFAARCAKSCGKPLEPASAPDSQHRRRGPGRVAAGTAAGARGLF